MPPREPQLPDFSDFKTLPSRNKTTAFSCWVREAADHLASHLSPWRRHTDLGEENQAVRRQGSRPWRLKISSLSQREPSNCKPQLYSILPSLIVQKDMKETETEASCFSHELHGNWLSSACSLSCQESHTKGNKGVISHYIRAGKTQLTQAIPSSSWCPPARLGRLSPILL